MDHNTGRQAKIFVADAQYALVLSMPECELCGRQSSQLYVANIEGATLHICSSCAAGAKGVKGPVARPAAATVSAQERVSNADVPSLIDGYGFAIRQARERMKLPLKVMAEMLSEKETLLLRIEEGKAQPTVELTRKLEKFLGIRLTEESRDESGFVAGKAPEATLGDFIKKG